MVQADNQPRWQSKPREPALRGHAPCCTCLEGMAKGDYQGNHLLATHHGHSVLVHSSWPGLLASSGIALIHVN